MGGPNTGSDLDGSRQFPVDVFRTVVHKLQCVPDLLAAWFNREVLPAAREIPWHWVRLEPKKICKSGK